LLPRIYRLPEWTISCMRASFPKKIQNTQPTLSALRFSFFPPTHTPLYDFLVLFQQTLIQTIFFCVAGKFDALPAAVFVGDGQDHCSHMHAIALHGDYLIGKPILAGGRACHLKGAPEVVFYDEPVFEVHEAKVGMKGIGLQGKGSSILIQII